jgi:hypothetical protein
VDVFQPMIDRDRCESIGAGRRCQLWRDHAPDHAVAWAEPKPITSYRRGRGDTARWHWIRWDAAGVVREVEPGSERLPWACMGVA